ncbi:MAG: GNAT family N-acetyltransferase [Acidobacteria bacterium]|nr:GNAT family N-acetyltransferase [Acidobacteriota bacterium]
MSAPVRTNELGQPIGPALPYWTPPPMPPAIPMAGRVCALRPLTSTHAPALWAAFSLDRDGRDWTYLSHGPYARYEDFAYWVADASASADPQFFGIEVPGELAHRATPRPFSAPTSASAAPSAPPSSASQVGIASYLRITPASGVIQVGHIHYSPRLQQTPAATEAMYLMMRRAFELGYRRCEWKCDALNAPSRRAAQRLGFSFEGVFRQAIVTKGRSRDTAWYACLDREWPALRDAFERWLAPANFDDEGRQRESLSSLTAPLLEARG